MKINTFTIENFKSIKKNTVALKKFTIFIGPNSSGKSSFLQALLILKRTLSKKPITNEFVTKTDGLDLGSFRDIVSKHSETSEIIFRINQDLELRHGISTGLPITSNVWYEISSSKQGFTQIRFGGKFDEYDIDFNSKMHVGETNAYCRNEFSQKDSLNIDEKHIAGIHPKMTATSNANQTNYDQAEFAKHIQRFNTFFRNGEFTHNMMEDFHYVPFFRVATKFAEATAPYDENFLAGDSEHVMRFLINNLSTNPDLAENVSKLMETLTGKRIRTRTHDFPNEKGVAMEFIKNGVSNAITNEGTGPNQAILLLTTLVGTREKSVIAIDEPEIHLHPTAQTKLAKIMIDLGITENKQIIFATHSEHMIFPFLSSIASKKKKTLSVKDVAIYYVSTDDNTSFTKFEELKINEHGQIEGGLKGFYDADLELLDEFYKND